jgi:quercetin dioxygenase-like cupin family protein
MTDSPVLRALPGQRWDGVAVLDYKPVGSAPFRAITRQVLIGDETLACELRYFEIAPGGHSTLERHHHAHGVLVLTGRGACLVGGQIHRIGAHDLVRIPPWTWHQLRADPDSPIGFLCMVNRERDRPVLPSEPDLAGLCADPQIAAFIRV